MVQIKGIAYAKNEVDKKYVLVKETIKCGDSNQSGVKPCINCYTRALMNLMASLNDGKERKQFFEVQLPYYESEKLEWLYSLKEYIDEDYGQYQNILNQSQKRDFSSLIDEQIKKFEEIPNMTVAQKRGFLLQELNKRIP